MHVAVLGPPPEVLAKEVERNAEQAEEGNESRVGHDRRNETALRSPDVEKLAVAVPLSKSVQHHYRPRQGHLPRDSY